MEATLDAEFVTYLLYSFESKMLFHCMRKWKKNLVMNGRAMINNVDGSDLAYFHSLLNKF